MFDPTPERLRAARRDGRVPRNRNLTAVFVVMAGLGLVAMRAETCVCQWGRMMISLWSEGPLVGEDPAQSIDQAFTLLRAVAQTMLPLLLGLLVVAFLVPIFQGGWVWAPRRLLPDMARLSPERGLREAFTSERFVEGLLALIKLGVALAVSVSCLWIRREELALCSRGDLGMGAAVMASLVLSVALYACSGVLIVSFVEYAYRWSRHRASLRMTIQEYRESMQERDAQLRVRSMPQALRGGAE